MYYVKESKVGTLVCFSDYKMMMNSSPKIPFNIYWIRKKAHVFFIFHNNKVKLTDFPKFSYVDALLT